MYYIGAASDNCNGAGTLIGIQIVNRNRVPVQIIGNNNNVPINTKHCLHRRQPMLLMPVHLYDKKLFIMILLSNVGPYCPSVFQNRNMLYKSNEVISRVTAGSHTYLL